MDGVQLIIVSPGSMCKVQNGIFCFFLWQGNPLVAVLSNYMVDIDWLTSGEYVNMIYININVLRIQYFRLYKLNTYLAC